MSSAALVVKRNMVDAAMPLPLHARAILPLRAESATMRVGEWKARNFLAALSHIIQGKHP